MSTDEHSLVFSCLVLGVLWLCICAFHKREPIQNGELVPTVNASSLFIERQREVLAKLSLNQSYSDACLFVNADIGHTVILDTQWDLFLERQRERELET